MVHNHEAFMEKMQLIADKDEQMRLIKAYWFNLPMEEFFTYMRCNMKDIGTGLQELIASKVLSKADKKSLNEDFDKGIALIKAIKQESIDQQVS